jgi:hypothetical protein
MKLKNGSHPMYGCPAEAETLRASSRWQPISLNDVIEFGDVRIKSVALNLDSPVDSPVQPAF